MFSLIIRDLLNPSNYSHDGKFLPDLYGDYWTNPLADLHIIPPRRQTSVGPGAQSDLKSDSSKFQVMLNVKHFQPNEIDVKTVDNYVEIRGKHEEQADNHGFVSREFTRRYQLPDDVQLDQVSSSLSTDGVLTIEAPRKAIAPPKKERVIPITIQQAAAVEEAQKHEKDLTEVGAENQKK